MHTSREGLYQSCIKIGEISNCYMFNFSLGSFGTFSIFDEFISLKWLVVERNRPKLEPLW